MSVAFYMDVHVHGAITEQLEIRGIDVITAQDDGRGEDDDDQLLARATELGRAIFTQDEDFLTIAATWQEQSLEFAGVVYAHQLRVGIGKCVEDLELIAKCYEPVDLLNRVEYLPL
jgi:predicted nuclease of predicted toxin-antitoxin system